MSTLQAAVTAAGIQHAGVTLIGAVASATVSVMKKDEALTDYLRSYDQPLELSGTGEVTEGKLHLHVTLYGEDIVTGGHLHRARVQDFFVHAYMSAI
jgi:uncharacterized protein